MKIDPVSPASPRIGRGQFITIISLALWMLVVSGLILAATWKNPVHRAVLGMSWGLILLWVIGGGLVMWRWRALWRRLADRVPGPWMVKFVVG